jgi:hypothetical protein
VAGKGKDPARRSLTTPRAITSVVAGVTLMSVLLTVRGTSVDARSAAAVVAAAWWLSPLVYYWSRVTTVTGAWVLGVGYIGASALFVLSIYRSRGSTAALGFLFVPTLLWAGMLMAVDVERALARWVWLRRQLRSGGGTQDGAGARAGRAASVWWQWTLPTGAVLAFLGLLWWNVYVAVAAVTWSVAGAVVAKAARHHKQAW